MCKGSSHIVAKLEAFRETTSKRKNSVFVPIFPEPELKAWIFEINFYKIFQSREKLRESSANLSANPSTDDLQPLYTNAYETAALIRQLIEPS